MSGGGGATEAVVSPEPEVEVEDVKHVLQVDQVQDGGRSGEGPADVGAQPVHRDRLIAAVLAGELGTHAEVRTL